MTAAVASVILLAATTTPTPTASPTCSPGGAGAWVTGNPYPETRACFRSGEIRILDSTGKLERTIAFNEVNRKL